MYKVWKSFDFPKFRQKAHRIILDINSTKKEKKKKNCVYISHD